MKKHSLALVCLMAITGGCATRTAGDLKVIQTQIGNETFKLEVADTDPTREKGLMQRDDMPADHGMLFVFDDESPRAFWMKNTRIPLDILFIDGTKHVISIQQMKAYDLSSTRSGGPAKYAIELNEGAAARAGAKVGDVIMLPK